MMVLPSILGDSSSRSTQDLEFKLLSLLLHRLDKSCGRSTLMFSGLYRGLWSEQPAIE